ALFAGSLGSSTLVNEHAGSYPGSGKFTTSGDDIAGQPGDQYFVGIWAPRRGDSTNNYDDQSFVSWFTTGHRLVRSGPDNSYPLVPADDTNAPSLPYRVVPFTYGQ